MDVAFHPYGLAGVFGFVATWAMAAFIWSHSSGHSVNKHLAILLVVEGIAVVTSALDFFFVAIADRHALGIMHFMADAALPPLYLLFLSHAFELPGARMLRTHAGHVVLWALALAGPALVLLGDDRFLVGATIPGPWVVPLFVYVTASFVLGIVAALIAFRRARTPSSRERARAFLVAFTFFDVVWGTIYGYSAAIAAGAMPDTVNEELLLLYALATPIFVALLAYAILKTQLFDLQLRIKVGIKRGTLVLVFLVVFVAAAETAQNFFSEQFGLAAGGIVAGVLLLAIRPLERVADRVATAALPAATGSPEYVAFKKLEVYRAAVEAAIETDRAIDERERSKLDRLAAKLGVLPEDARAVQRDALSAMAA